MVMTPEKLFHELLGLGDQWKVTRCEFDAQASEVGIWVEEAEHFWRVECARQRHDVRLYDHTEELAWRHLNVFEHKCSIYCKVPRGVRPDGKVYRVNVPWEGLCKHFTAAFEAMALLLLRQMPVNAAAKIIEEHDTRLWRMLKAHVQAAYQELDFSGVVCVGCDEMSARKGHRYVSVFCDMIGKRVLFACAGKDKSTWERFVESLHAHNGNHRAVTQVSMDMSPAYISGARENLGDQAVLVFDKFHVIAKVNEAVEDTRRAEMRFCNSEERAQLKGSRWALLKNPEHLTQRQKEHYSGLLKSSLCAVKSHQMRLALQDIYALPDVGEAKRKLQAWCRWVRWISGKHPQGLFASMLRCSRMIERHLEGILAYWISHVTNAFLEGLNSVFSAVKRAARGFRSNENLITMLYFHSAKLNLPASHSK